MLGTWLWGKRQALGRNFPPKLKDEEEYGSNPRQNYLEALSSSVEAFGPLLN